jgi:hypothetical protein
MLLRNFDRAIRRAVIGDHNFSAQAARSKSISRLINAKGE